MALVYPGRPNLVFDMAHQDDVDAVVTVRDMITTALDLMDDDGVEYLKFAGTDRVYSYDELSRFARFLHHLSGAVETVTAYVAEERCELSNEI